ncbi:AAA family ATPase, partial [Alteromonas sp. 5E99-2]|uniref:FimV/HubP family polar landmark protein n=1 Tax=Alteromonas sp. 5E99-2 TaxID=2817683 RepID=UPI001ACEDE16
MNNTRSSSFIASIAFVFFIINMGIGHIVNAQESVQIKGPKGATEQFSGNVYGPITSDDTLWRVAERYRQNRSLSIYQVMLAIYELNPEAFEQRNLNLMIDGSILRLPSERYIARVDLEEAKARAEGDEQAWQRATRDANGKVAEIKPISPLVNQDDLSSTKDALEKRLNSLDQTQTRQFDELKDQFALSIKSVESLLEDNQKLYERIDKVNGDLDALREQVDGDVKSTMSAQSQSIEEMLQLLKEEQSLRQEAENSSLLKKLSSPIALMVISIVMTLLVLGGVAYWLLGKKKAPKESAEPVVSDAVAPVDAVSVSETDDLLDEPIDDSEDISDDELFNDDDLLDDVLSSELEDSLDDELENFTDLSDEMLVPEPGVEGDSDLDDLFEEGDSEIGQSDLDDLFGDSNEVDAFDISGDDESKESDQGEESNQEEESEAVDVDALFDAAVDSADFDASDVADKLGIDGDNLDEDAIGKIDDQIQKQGQELDKDTENLIGEIDQLEMMGGMLDELDLSDEEESQETPVEDSSNESEEQNSSSEDAITDDVIDELIDEPLTADSDAGEDASADDIDDIFNSVSQPPSDDLTDDLLDELEAENPESSNSEDDEDSVDDVDALLESMSPEPSDDLTDDLLDELEAENPESSISDEEDSVDDVDALLESMSPEPSDDLTDDLLDELEAENPESSISEDDK